MTIPYQILNLKKDLYELKIQVNDLKLIQRFIRGLKWMLIQSNIVYKSNFSFYIHPLLQKLFMNRIKEVLQENGIKQTWLAEKLGKSFNIVNDYCNNRRQPSLELLFKIGEILRIDPKDLLKSKKLKNS
jgi:putative transcriptional regulator